MTLRLRSLAAFCYHHRGAVIGAWVIALVGVIALSRATGDNYSFNFSVPGSESQRAYALLNQRFPVQAGDTVSVVVRAEDSIASAGVQEKLERLLGELKVLPHVVGVQDPYAGGGQVSADGRTALATVQLDARSELIPDSVGSSMIDLARKSSGDGLQVELGGALISAAQYQGSSYGEFIGVILAAVILLIAFGSLLAMVLPIAVALCSIGIGTALIALSSHLTNSPSFSTKVAAMIGVGVGIDYALFVVTRFRQGLHAGLTAEEAVVTAVDTSGRAVLFAGLTVVIALFGMLVVRMAFVSGMGISASIVVFVTMIASVTLLPALLGVVGGRIDRLRLPWLHRDTGQRDGSAWYRWSRFVQHHPWLLATVGLVAAVALALPAFSLRLGFIDAGGDSRTQTTRRAYDLLSQGFGPGFNGPFVVAVALPNHSDAGDLGRLTAAIAADRGVASVAQPRLNPSGDAAVISVIPTTSPQDADTASLLHRLRGSVIPTAIAGSDLHVYAGGATAVNEDFSDIIAGRLPLFIAIVIGLSFLLLTVVFRSVLVPVKAAIMNLLSIGAAYGVTVMVFQWGWGRQLIGIDRSYPIQAFVPLMMFAILFGLSMDYEVFLLSRIREDYLHSGENGLAVANGVAATGRVITAAAAVMVTFFLSFVFGASPIIKLFGLGFASAIFFDATLIRMVIVPATMELLGKANWWLPGWLDRRLPHLDIEGHTASSRAAAAREAILVD